MNDEASMTNDSAPEGSSETKSTADEASDLEEKSLLEHGVDATLYGLSLPERALRGMVGCTSGALKETAEFAIPDAMKGSRLYRMTVSKMLSFLVEDVGMLKAAEDEDATQLEQSVAKMAVGNVLDFAGMSVLHVSPIWVLAIFSDLTAGTKTYVDRLGKELKKQGIIEESATIDSLDAILDNLEKTSGLLADGIDAPPTTMKELRDSVEQLRDEASRVEVSELFPSADLERIWNEIEETAKVEDRSIFEVSSAVAMLTFNQITRAGQGAYTGVKVGFDLLNDNVVNYYSHAFREIHVKGYYTSVSEAYEPYVQGLGRLFEGETETTTEKVLRGKPFRAFWSWFKGLFGTKPKAGQ